MNTNELKNLLGNIADSMKIVKKSFPAEMCNDIISALKNLDEETLNFILPLVQITKPTMSKADLEHDLNNILNLIQLVKTLSDNGSLTKIESICNNLKNRTFVLNLISRFV